MTYQVMLGDRAVPAALEIAELVNRNAVPGELRVGLGGEFGRGGGRHDRRGGRLDFTLIREAANTAARVESATRATGDDVFITSETRRRLSTSDGTGEERPAIPLKGKANEVALYAPLSDRKPRQHEHRAALSAGPLLVLEVYSRSGARPTEGNIRQDRRRWFSSSWTAPS